LNSYLGEQVLKTEDQPEFRSLDSSQGAIHPSHIIETLRLVSGLQFDNHEDRLGIPNGVRAMMRLLQRLCSLVE
jgi:hypothetical protein